MKIQKKKKMITSCSDTNEIRNQRLLIANGKCECCGEPLGECAEMHHVFSAGRMRKHTESVETVVMLRPECHRGKNSFNVIKNLRIKVSAELIEKYGEDKAREKAGGKLYFKEEAPKICENLHEENEDFDDE